MKRFLLQGTVVRNLLQGESGKIHRGVLLAVFLIIAVGVYVYYFTDLIKPGEDNGIETFHGSLVKKPLPQRPVTAAAVQEEKPATETQQIAAVPGQKTEAGPATPVKPSIEQKISSTPQTGTKQENIDSLFAKAAKSETKTHMPSSGHPSPYKRKPASNENIVAQQGESKPVTPAAHATKSASKPSNGTYTLQIGVYVTTNAMLAQKARLKTAGLNPVVTKGPNKMEPMNRLLIGEFENYAEAAIQKQKLGKATQDAFILPEKGKYVLYAGSYFVKQSAEKERIRLIEAGFKPEVRKTSIPVSTTRLTAGNFQSRKSAEQEAERLKNLGIKASVVRPGS